VETRARRVGPVLRAVGVFVALLVVAAVVSWMRAPWAALPEEVAVPARGETVATYAPDGAPVFVRDDPDAGLTVLGATDPHGPRLVLYCPSSGWYEAPASGSRFTARGSWVGGPAPAGLVEVPHQRTGERLRLGAVRPRDEGPPRDRPEGPGDVGPVGPACVEEELPEDVVVHLPPDGRLPPASAVLGRDEPSFRWVVARVEQVGVPNEPGSHLRICDVTDEDTCPPDAARSQANGYLWRGGIHVGTVLLRAPDGRAEVLFPALPEDLTG
jgi:hypothetical protein